MLTASLRRSAFSWPGNLRQVVTPDIVQHTRGFRSPYVGVVSFRVRKLMSYIYIYIYRGRNVLFNDALNTFYLRLYGVRYMVKDHSDSERGNPLPPHRLLFPISSKGSFICTIPQTG